MRAIDLSCRALSLGPAGLLDLLLLSVLGAYVEIGIRVLPLPRVAASLGIRMSGSPPPRLGLGSTQRQLRRRRIVNMMTRHWPVADRDGLCLRRALLTGWIYRDRDPVLQIGVRRSRGSIEAHAWVALEGGTIGADGMLTSLPIPAVPRRRSWRRPPAFGSRVHPFSRARERDHRPGQFGDDRRET